MSFVRLQRVQLSSTTFIVFYFIYTVTINDNRQSQSIDLIYLKKKGMDLI